MFSNLWVSCVLIHLNTGILTFLKHIQVTKALQNLITDRIKLSCRVTRKCSCPDSMPRLSLKLASPGLPGKLRSLVLSIAAGSWAKVSPFSPGICELTANRGSLHLKVDVT